MTWSNVGNEPGRLKLPRANARLGPSPPVGAMVRMHGKLAATLGGRWAETPDARRERLRRISSGG